MNNFIGKYKIQDTKICSNLVEYFNGVDSDKKSPGFISTPSGNIIRKEEKESIDLSFSVKEISNLNIFKHYFFELSQFCEEYKKRYSYCNLTSKWEIYDRFNIQYYAPGGGYKIFHMERSSCKPPVSSRHLVFMTYLNTVKSGGQTEFLYQKVKENAVIGKTLIWPADWTHTHRGIPSFKEDKYIITGWYNFIE
jgi:hypothetical protein